MDSFWHAAATDLHPVKELEKYSQVSIDPPWHAAATDLHPVQKYDLG
jgi:hypothetical protein